MTIYNNENCEKLAQAVVDGWDIETLRLFAYDSLKDTYENDKEAFEHDCEAIEYI